MDELNNTANSENTQSSEFFTEDEVLNEMTTQETLAFQSHPLYQYVKQIATVVGQNRAQLHSNEILLRQIKSELDAIRPRLQTFLDKIPDEPSDSQSLLQDNSQVILAGERANDPKPFVSVEWDGMERGLIISSSTEFKIRGTDCARSRCRILLEELHGIVEMRKMTVAGKKVVKINGRNTTITGEAVPPLTLQYRYQMEINRRKLDTAQSELMKTLKLEVNGYVSKILESYKSCRDEEGVVVKRNKRSTDEDDSESTKRIQL